MNSLTAFDNSAAEDKGTVALRELLDFLEKPQSIGLDNLKESLRNIVQLALEVKGYDTGYALQHLMHGEHSSLAPEGISKIDKERKRRIQQFWDDMNEIEREMLRSFNTVFESAVKQIIEIKQDITSEIATIDARIEEKADTEIEAQAMKAASSKRKKLVRLKSHIKKKEEQIQEASSTADIVGIHNDIIEDVQDFKDGKFNPNKTRPNPLAALSNIVGFARAKNDDKYDSDEYNSDEYNSDRAGLDIEQRNTQSSDSDDDDKSGEDQTGKDEDQNKEDEKPSMPNIDF